MTQEEANHLFNDVTSGRGSVSLAKLDAYVRASAVQEAIRKYRSANDGDQLTHVSFMAFMKGEGVHPSDALAMWHRIDENRNGKVNLVEFRDWAADMLKLSTLTETFPIVRSQA